LSPTAKDIPIAPLTIVSVNDLMTLGVRAEDRCTMTWSWQSTLRNILGLRLNVVAISTGADGPEPELEDDAGGFSGDDVNMSWSTGDIDMLKL